METLPILCVITLMMFDCDKRVQPTPEQHQLIEKYTVADQKINAYFDALDSPETSHGDKKKIICETFPTFYNQEYKPLLLQVDKRYTEAELDANLQQALNGFQTQYDIQC